MMKRSRWITAVLGIGISLIFLWFAFRDLRPAEVWASMRQVNAWLLLAGVAVFFVSTAIIALRWGFLLRSARRIPLRQLTELVCIGYAGNNVYPFRSGEVLRIFLLQRQHAIPFARGTTTVVVERVFDGLVMLSFIVIPLLFGEIAAPEARLITTVAGPVFLAATAVFFALAARPSLLRGLLHWFSRRLPDRLGRALTGIGEEVLAGLEGLRSPADLAGAALSSYGTWIVHAGVYWLVALAFPDLHVSFGVLVLVVGVVNLAGLIPASPGQFGVFEFLVSAVLIAAGAPSGTAQAYALVVHMVIWLPVTLVGLGLLLRQGLGLGAITRAQDIETAADTQPH